MSEQLSEIDPVKGDRIINQIKSILDTNRVIWKYPEFPFIWEDDDGNFHRYRPIFYLPNFNVYLDPISYLRPSGKIDDEIDRINDQNNIITVFIKPGQFEWNEIKVLIHAGKSIIDLKESNKAKSTYDNLTGLLNKQEITDVLKRAHAKWKRDEVPLSVIMAELGSFKLIIEKCGHIASDMVLQELAQRMVKTLRPFDRIGRYSREKFVFVLLNCDFKGAEAAVNRVNELVTEQPLRIPRGKIKIKLHYGIVSTSESALKDPHEFIREADKVLLHNKKRKLK